jgi:hypothetical protein
MDANKNPYPIVVFQAEKGPPEVLPNDKIVLCKNYKMALKKGRKDPLRGYDVLCIPSATGGFMIPLTEALTFANLLQALVETLEKTQNKGNEQ